MRALINISGGAIKLVGLLACFREIVKTGYVPKYVSGVSAGAIIAFCYACGRLDEAFELAKRSSDRRVIFSWANDPVGSISGFSLPAIWKLIRGKNYLGVMDNLEKNIRSIVSSKDFRAYRSDDRKPSVFVSMVNESTGVRRIVNLKLCSYEDAISCVIASASIAPTIKSRRINGVEYNDGGHRDSSAGGPLLEGLLVPGIEECITIWSRPDRDTFNRQKIGKTSSFFNRLINFTIGVFLKESSLNDEYKESELCKEAGVEYSPIYLDDFASSTYDIEDEEIQEGVIIGVQAARKYLDGR